MKEKERAHRVIGIDFGLARIGTALSDERKVLAFPLFTVAAEKRQEDTVQKLLKLLDEHASANHYIIEQIVVGLPLLMSGKKGFFADEVSSFIEAIRIHSSIPIISWDERLTSVQAERSLRESNMTRKKRTKFVDTVAATIILQSFLDHRAISMMI